MSKNEKVIASRIYKILINKKRNLINKKNSVVDVKNKIAKLGISKIDYIKLLNINKIIKPYRKKILYRVFIAYYINSTRLIDNV